jgi:hypothetical protein
MTQKDAYPYLFDKKNPFLTNVFSVVGHVKGEPMDDRLQLFIHSTFIHSFLQHLFIHAFNIHLLNSHSFNSHSFVPPTPTPQKRNVLDKLAEDILPGGLILDKIIPECTVSKTFPLSQLSVKIDRNS